MKMENYLAWMKSAYYISRQETRRCQFPAHFPQADCRLESRSSDAITTTGEYCDLGYAFEQATDVGKRRPIRA